MIKEFLPTDWPTTHEAPTWVKTASAGFRGNDLREFRKSAGERVTDLVKRALEKRLPGEELLVVNAMGATEIEGPNRNGDGWTLDTLAKHHHTFKTAKWFRDHQTDRDHYGLIKEATFDPHTGRVPVVAFLNATKEAADRNGGRIANLELNDIHSNRDIPVSMSCNVKFDACSGCHNRARNRDEYCDATTCKYGGLKKHANRVSQDGHVLHMDNPSEANPTFFDLSRISDRQAARCAYVYGRVKSAGVPMFEVETGHAWIAPLVKKLAAEEARVKNKTVRLYKCASCQEQAPDHTAVSALLGRKGMLSPEDWEVAFDVRLPDMTGVYTKLASSTKLLSMTPVLQLTEPTKRASEWAAKQRLASYDRSDRIKSAAVASLFETRRAATERPEGITLDAFEYVAYQLAALFPYRENDEAVKAAIQGNFSG